MADKAISELVSAEQITATDMFVLEQNGTAKKLTGQVLLNWLTRAADGHGGIQSIAKLSTTGLADTYRITLADTTTFDFVVTNGRSVDSIRKTKTSGLVDTYTIDYNDGTTGTFTVTNGAKGEKGDNAYIWVKYASQEPTSESSSIGDIPDAWIGVYSGPLAEAPADWSQYRWYKIKGEQGEPGKAAVLLTTEAVYQVSDSGQIIPSGVWSETIPVVPQGKYLWTRVTNTFNSGAPAVAYSVTRMGMDGSGSVTSVANVSPDENGNVPLTAEKLGALPRSGGSVTGSINMNGNPIGGLNPPTESDQVVNKDYVDQNFAQFEILWENASPNSEFPEQNISLNNVEDYILFFVEFRYNTTTSRKVFSILRRGYEVPCFFLANLTSEENRVLFMTRTLSVSTSGAVSISNCFNRNEDTAPTKRADRMIPVRIYGIKGVHNA